MILLRSTRQNCITKKVTFVRAELLLLKHLKELIKICTGFCEVDESNYKELAPYKYAVCAKNCVLCQEV